MFERYIETKDFLELPLSGRLYCINTDGIILDINGNIISFFLDEEKDLVVNLFWIEGYKKYKLCKLIALTFKPVIVYDHRTNESLRFFSAHECERKLGLNRSIVYYRIKSGNIFHPGYSFRYENTVIEKCNKDKYGIPLLMRNIDTNEIKEFKTILECSYYLKVSKKVIQKRLKDNKRQLFRNYQFQRKDCVLPWVHHSPSKSLQKV